MVARLHSSPTAKVRSICRTSIEQKAVPYPLKINEKLSIESYSSHDGDSVQSSESGTTRSENDYILDVMEESINLQKEKLGPYHASVTRNLHSLALEYRARSRYEEAVTFIQEGIELLNVRINTRVATHHCDFEGSASISDSSVDSMISFMSNDTASEIVQSEEQLLEEKSSMIMCLGNIHRTRGMHNRAAQCYAECIMLLLDAGHDEESPRMQMTQRMLKRVERSQMMKSNDAL